jgi:putative membrane protein
MNSEHNPEVAHPQTPAQYLRIIFSGFAMGSVEIIPGVSGGTMAFILGIYGTLINTIKSFNLKAIGLLTRFKIGELVEHVNLRFLISLGLGMGLAIFTLARLLRDLLETQPTMIFAFFAGLILASVLAIGVKIRWGVQPLIAFVGGTVFAFVVVGLEPLRNAGHEPLILIISGALAAMALILPGISGSFILLILGQYKYVLNAVTTFDLLTLAMVGIGVVIGIISFSRIVSYMLKHYEQVTIAALVGFILGSLRTIWVEALWIRDEETAALVQMRQLDGSTIAAAVIILMVGFLVVSALDHLQSGDNPVFRRVWKIHRPAAPSGEAMLQEKAQALE